MKRLIINSLIFAFVLFGIIAFLDYLSMQDDTRELFARWTDSLSYITENVGPAEITPYIDMVRAQDGTTGLIIGDSVCRQMFNGLRDNYPEFTVVGSNAALTMSGQYILAKEYLDNHPDATDIFLIVLPGALETTYDTSWGYQYAVMPFVETDTLKNLDADTIEIMQSVYGKFFMNKNVVNAIDKSAVNRKIYLNYLNKYKESYAMSYRYELADKYIGKISKLCDEAGVNLHLYPCPVCENKKEYVLGLAEEYKADSILSSINPDYISMVSYFSAEETIDGTHFAKEYATEDILAAKIEEYYQGTKLLEMLMNE